MTRKTKNKYNHYTEDFRHEPVRRFHNHMQINHVVGRPNHIGSDFDAKNLS